MSSIVPITKIKLAVFGASAYGKNCIRYILGNPLSSPSGNPLSIPLCNSPDNLPDNPSVELVGFYEPNEELAASITQLFDVKRYIDPSELLEAADAIIISLPVSKRYELAALSLKKGKHILVESPVSFNPSEAEHLISLANEAQVIHVTSIGGVLALTESLDKDNQNIFIEGKRFVDNGENIFDILVEDIHLFLQITNSGIRKIIKNTVGRSTAVHIEFENEMSAHYLISENINKNDEKIIIHTGSNKIITINKGSKSIMVERDIETLLSSISENHEHYPFFEKDFVSIFAASKVA